MSWRIKLLSRGLVLTLPTASSPLLPLFESGSFTWGTFSFPLVCTSLTLKGFIFGFFSFSFTTIFLFDLLRSACNRVFVKLSLLLVNPCFTCGLPLEGLLVFLFSSFHGPFFSPFLGYHPILSRPTMKCPIPNLLRFYLPLVTIFLFFPNNFPSFWFIHDFHDYNIILLY